MVKQQGGASTPGITAGRSINPGNNSREEDLNGGKTAGKRTSAVVKQQEEGPPPGLITAGRGTSTRVDNSRRQKDGSAVHHVGRRDGSAVHHVGRRGAPCCICPEVRRGAPCCICPEVKRDGSAVHHRVGEGRQCCTSPGGRRNVVYPGSGKRRDVVYTQVAGGREGYIPPGGVYGGIPALHMEYPSTSLATPAHPASSGPTGVQLLLCRTADEHHLGSNL